MPAPLLTFGHGAADQAFLTTLLQKAGVARVVDVRRFPGSRKHPHMNRDAVGSWLGEAGLGYRWAEALGGRRRPADPSSDPWWRVEAFRGYAAHMRTPAFEAAADELVSDVTETTTAVMCSESLWWRCHRRMVADYCVLSRGVPVVHLGHDGRLTEHPVAEGARLEDGRLVYDRQ